eukprot:9489899-Pyramimonas_sp.AAC.1
MTRGCLLNALSHPLTRMQTRTHLHYTCVTLALHLHNECTGTWARPPLRDSEPFPAIGLHTCRVCRRCGCRVCHQRAALGGAAHAARRKQRKRWGRWGKGAGGHYPTGVPCAGAGGRG